MKDQTMYWVAFNLVKGVGPVRLEKLLDHFGDIESAWKAPAFRLQQAGLSQKLSRKVAAVRNQLSLEKLADQILKAGIEVLTWDDQDYPPSLRVIPQSPFVLYLKGKLSQEDSWGVGLVGTRRYTDYGRQVAEQIAGELAGSGISLISGLARGIDGLAHQRALAAGGRTIAVLGSGLDQIYPPEHRSLAEAISRQGALVSDYPLGTPPEASNFPPRNRIIAGLAKVVLVVEAGLKSGALITAGYAAEQGKEVFAVPGKITAPMSKGTNLLIKQGAHPLLEAQDILDILNLSRFAQVKVARPVLPADPREALLFQIVGDEPVHVDLISQQTDLPIEQVTATLALMELKGMVRKTFGMKYVAVREIQPRYGKNPLSGKER